MANYRDTEAVADALHQFLRSGRSVGSTAVASTAGGSRERPGSTHSSAYGVTCRRPRGDQPQRRSSNRRRNRPE
jgi:hypothetical protein